MCSLRLKVASDWIHGYTLYLILNLHPVDLVVRLNYRNDLPVLQDDFFHH
jgi:hypothetical protein